MMALRQLPYAVRHMKADYVLIFVLVGLGIAIFLPKIAAVTLIDHDDVISVIAATCNQGHYRQFVPSGQWVSASEWQQYWQLRSFGCLDQISNDLVQYDIHPPLYFWLLHLWFCAFGVSIMGGLALNLILLVASAVVIYISCRLMSVSSFFSFTASLAWMLCLPSRTAGGVVRQYAFLSFLTAVLLLLVILWLKRGQARYVFGLGVVLAAGFLTHYQFPIPAAFTLLFAGAILRKRRAYSEIKQLLIATSASVLTFLLADQGFMESVLQANDQAQKFTVGGFLQRTVATGGALLQIFNPLDWSHPLPYGLGDWHHPLYGLLNALNLALGAIGAYLALRIALRAYKARAHTLDAMISVGHLPIFVAITSWSAIAAMYVFCISPVHAIGLQYLHFVTPFLFVAVAQAAETQRDAITHGIVVALTPLLLVCAVAATALFVVHRPEQEPILAIKDADALIIDSDRIGILPTVLWHANAETKIYAAMQDDLLADFPVLPSNAYRAVYFITSNAYGNSLEKRRLILERLSKLGYGNGVRAPAGVVPLIPLGGEIYAFRR